jgi:hypothetical protein
VTQAELFDGAALADGLSPALRTPVSVLVAGGIVTGIFDGDVPAEVLRDPHAGRLTVGGPAHFTLVHGDPLSDPAALWRVWRAH